MHFRQLGTNEGNHSLDNDLHLTEAKHTHTKRLNLQLYLTD